MAVPLPLVVECAGGPPDHSIIAHSSWPAVRITNIEGNYAKAMVLYSRDDASRLCDWLNAWLEETK